MSEDVTAQDVAEDDPVVREIASAKERRAKSAEPREPREPREPKAITDLRNDDARSVTEWLRELSPSGAVRITVNRLSPESWGGVNTGGVVGTYEHMIDEDWVREHHGGGTYQMTVRTPHPKRPGWVFTPGGTRQIRIAGDPRTDDVFRDKTAAAPPPPVASGPSSDVVKQVVMSMERQLERAHNSGGPDIATMQALISPLQQQLEQMGRMLSEKDRQLSAAQQVKPEQDPFRDKMIATLLDGDTARITALRAQYESELRQVKQSAIENEARLRDGFDRDKQSLAMAHDRELKSLGSAHMMTVAAKEQSEATSRMLLEAEIRRLAADLGEAKTELIALRAKKDKTIIEQATEFAQIKEAIGEITGDSEPSKPSTIDKVLEYAGNLPVVQNAIARAAGGESTPPPAPPPPPQPRMRRPPPQLRHFAGPDGNLYRKQPDGTMELEAARPPGQPAIPQIPPATIKLAVDFLEAACRNGQDPAEVATSVRSMIPADVLTAIRELGIDGFLSTLAKLDGTSPLSSQAGRNWTRKLGKALVGE